MDEKKQEAIFNYVFDNEYDPEYINGVYGGVNTNGELVMHFYFERWPLPYEERSEVDEEGRLTGNTTITEPDEFKIRRAVKTGVIINKETAISVCQWMKERLKEMGVDDDDL